MAQHDYSIANQGFPATRADINNALSAIATNNSGTSAPSTQYAGQFWIDTTSSTWTLYIHDGTDDIQFATIDTSANTVNFIDSALDVVTDTTPQLGGNLDLNSSDITGTGNINITGDITASGNLLVDTIEPQSGTTLTLGANGDTITIPSGATLSNSGTATGFGKVLQVVSTTSNSTQSINSQTFTELTSLTTSITPSSASSKILILGRVAFASTTGSSNSFVQFRLRRDSTDICQGDGASGSMVNVTATGFSADNDLVETNIPFTFLDSPNTTSAISYKIMGANWTGASGFTINRPTSPDGLFYNGFVTSTLTVIEIE